MSVNSRAKGVAFEIWMAKHLRELGYQAITSRSESKRLDDRGCDLVDNTQFSWQMKAVERLKPGYHTLLSKMRDNGLDLPIIAHRKNNQGITITMSLEDFEKLLLKPKP